MGSITSQITSPSNVYSTAHSGADQRKHQSSASLAFVQGIHRGPVNSPHKWPVTRKMFPFDDAIMIASETAMTIIYVRKTLHGALVSTRRGIYFVSLIYILYLPPSRYTLIVLLHHIIRIFLCIRITNHMIPVKMII